MIPRGGRPAKSRKFPDPLLLPRSIDWLNAWSWSSGRRCPRPLAAEDHNRTTARAPAPGSEARARRCRPRSPPTGWSLSQGLHVARSQFGRDRRLDGRTTAAQSPRLVSLCVGSPSATLQGASVLPDRAYHWPRDPRRVTLARPLGRLRACGHSRHIASFRTGEILGQGYLPRPWSV